MPHYTLPADVREARHAAAVAVAWAVLRSFLFEFTSLDDVQCALSRNFDDCDCNERLGPHVLRRSHATATQSGEDVTVTVTTTETRMSDQMMKWHKERYTPSLSELNDPNLKASTIDWQCVTSLSITPGR
jgi:hypothetical protein